MTLAACSNACSKEKAPVTQYPTTSPIVEGPVLEAATINWGMAPGVISLYTPRLPVLAEEAEKLQGIGLICSEELWTLESKQVYIKALGPDMHTFYAETRGENQQDGINVCTPSRVKETAACARKNCGNLPNEEQTICVFQECQGELYRIYLFGAPKCLHCLAASVGQSIDGVIDTCVQQKDKPPIAGASRAFDGQNGVVLASRWPLQNQEVLRLRASFSNRAALFATVELAGHESIEVACAHISTETKLPPNHPDFSSWDEEMNAQIEDISARLKERAGNRPSLFLGDMNAGPALDGWISSEAPKVWKRIEELGFHSPAIYADEPFCTICEKNTLRSFPGRGNYLIDHVLLRDPAGGTQLEPILVHPFLDQLYTFRGYGIDWEESNLSDHYGVVVNFRVRTE